ncbi:hypothetical protein [Dokdonia sinensis]|nr:hypothetical protein [Dokdonia sinensis]
MRKVYTLVGICFGVACLFLMTFLAAHNINASGATTAAISQDIIISKIYEGGVKDIVFETPNGDYYYINRGLEQGFTLSGLEEKLLNKSVTLRLTKKLAGVSKHIHQMQVGDNIIYSELN